MSQIKFVGSINGPTSDKTFEVEVKLSRIPTLAEAQEIGKAVDNAVRQLFASKGGTLVADTAPGAIRGGSPGVLLRQ